MNDNLNFTDYLLLGALIVYVFLVAIKSFEPDTQGCETTWSFGREVCIEEVINLDYNR